MRPSLVLCLALTSCATATPDPVFTALADIPVVDAPDAVLEPDAPADVPRPDVTADVTLDAGVDAAVDRPLAVDVPVAPLDAPMVVDDVPAVVDAGIDVPAVPDVPAAPDVPVLTGYRVARDDPGARWFDACAAPGHQTVLVGVDGGNFRTTMPFPFRYWGVAVDEGAAFTVSPDGYVTFQPGASTPANGIIPNRLDGVQAVIAAQWRDLRTRSSGVCLALVGNTVGSRRWVIQWSDARYFTSDLSHLNFQIALNESNHAIDLAYDAMTWPEPSTVALENWDGSRSVVPYDIPQPITFANRRVRFIPQ